MIERVLPTMSTITIRTATKGEFIATSLVSRASSAQRPIVACAYAAGLNWWRIAPQIVAFDCVQCSDERVHAWRLVFNRLQLPDQREQFGGKFVGNLVAFSQALAHEFPDRRPSKATIE